MIVRTGMNWPSGKWKDKTFEGESALFELDAIVRLCDGHAIEFSDFAALDEIILQTGEAEQERSASAAAGKRKREDNWPAGCTRPTVTA